MNPLYKQLAEKKVNKANHNQKNIRPRQVILYRNVFYSRVSSAVVLLLCLSFLLQPIERVFASETTPIDSETSATINLAVDAGLSDSTPEAPTEASETTSTDVVSSDAPETNVANADDGSSNTVTEDVSEVSDQLVGETDVADGADSKDTSESSNDESSTTTVFTDEEIQDLINPEDELPPAELEVGTTTATSTEIPVAVTTVHSDAVMQFNRNDCVTVEDGSFYCQSKKEEAEQGTDGMYALQDKDGDLEIFLQKNGELAQLTFNTVDDAAPVFDTKSNTIVWHRLVDERYQIISYDLESEREVQLTADNVNNMEPSRSGNFTVWQRWNDTNWDIVLYDGTETKFLTDSLQHDIAPNVKGDLVMWNRLASDNTQTIELFDIVTGEFTTITDEEGGALSNPRMVLVYETEFANGDVVTKGYNVETGEVTPLANDPAELPEELPEPDATGETRALVQPKNPTKEDAEISEDVFPGIDSDPNLSGTSTASSTYSPQSGDLHIASSSSYIAGSTPNTGTNTETIADMTLDLTPPVLLPADIPQDLVVPPFVPDVSIETSE
ncbi:hypothetical protein K2P47_03145 [Patescibacteria group bacterium]|nr:hypothetical protein [Patescibacteria group bacterium]